MATYQQRGTNWRVQVRLRGHKISATFDTHEEARAWASAQEAKLLAGAKVKGGQAAFLTPVDLFRRYAEEVSPTKRGERWEVIRLAMLERFPAFAKALRDFGPEDVATWRDGRLKDVAAGSVNRELNLISAVFSAAIKEWRIGELRENPVHLVSRPANPRARKRRVADAEVALIRKQLGWVVGTAPRTLSQWVAWSHALAVETAMRKGELLGMVWEHVHPEAAYLHLPITKNGDERDVPLSRAALSLLAMLPAEGRAGPVVPVAPGSFDTLFRRAVKAAGIVGMRFHDSRREATTRFAPKVGNALDLAKITGHRDVRTLERVYYAPTATDLAKKLD